ncbi:MULTISPECIES: poly-gamma-glutamate biosynthesis protein PgsC/CapC [Salinibaculum]|uniref:poly-gamma-glutamate biosynthesis protein PgsC/CapC n=1 Tax=Salinibaculum TaxID=2732368 RepID=UPI0030D54A3D
MLVVTVLMILGLLGGIIAAQLQGLRLGGVIIVPLFAIYTLRTFGTFPVLVMSVIGGYVSLWIVKRRLLLYGRPLFVIAIVTSGLVPLLVYAFVALGLGPAGVISELGFIGSVLPGIAAYNFHRLPSERRIVDALWSMALLLFLVVVGIGLVIFVGLTPLSTVTPPVLLGPKSDIANAFGLVVRGSSHPTILPFPKELGMLGLGLFFSEAVRARWGLRIGGLIVLPLLVLFALRNEWLLLLYLVGAVSAYAGIQLLHSWTLIYGRVLLSMGVIFGLLVTISIAPALSFANGLLPFFTGILGGVGAYNLHTVAPAERRASLVVAAGVFVVLSGVARLFLTPFPDGMLVQIGIEHLLGGALIVGLALLEGYHLEAIRPSDLDSISAIWEAEDVNPEERPS